MRGMYVKILFNLFIGMAFHVLTTSKERCLFWCFNAGNKIGCISEYMVQQTEQ